MEVTYMENFREIVLATQNLIIQLTFKVFFVSLLFLANVQWSDKISLNSQ